MDQFSHDLTLALEETSLVDRARWGGQRRRTCSTGNLPCAPQPTEDSSSTDNAQKAVNPKTNIDGLDSHNVVLPSDSEDDKDELLMRLPCKLGAASAIRFGALESDSLNETFSPARFFKPNARRKRKLKRMSVEYDLGAAAGVAAQGDEELTPPFGGNCTMRKRCLKPDSSSGACRSNLFFCGKRKRSNRDRYHEYDVKFHSASVPRHNYWDEYSMRPRSYSSNATKPQSDCLLPLNKGLVSKIERISQQQQKTSPTTASATVTSVNATTEPLAPTTHTSEANADDDDEDTNACSAGSTCQPTAAATSPRIFTSAEKSLQDQNFQAHRQKSAGNRHSWRRSQLQQQLQFAVDQHPMDCEELYDFLSSSSLSSSSESEDNANATNDTGREGDDELTDWPGNEVSSCLAENRKLTKKQNPTLPAQLTGPFLGEEDTLMSVSLMGRSSGDSITGGWASAFAAAAAGEKLTPEAPPRFQASDPIAIAARSTPFSGGGGGDGSAQHTNNIPPLKQIESEMSGETSNPFLASPPCQPYEVREIRAGCRRIKGERPGFSIKTSVNERLARFLQDPRQSQMRLPDLEIYEHDSLTSLAGMYSLNMSLDNGCAVLSKTSNTTQSENTDQPGLQSRLLFGDFKRRRCYDGKSAALPNE